MSGPTLAQPPTGRLEDLSVDVDAPGTDRRAVGPAGPAAGTGDPMVGRLLDGRYRVGDRIARGGMASVYRATDLRLDRPVAVKVMHAGLGDDEDFAFRFVREARAAARLSDPHVVGVFDQGQEGGTVFLVMEYVAGHTLRDVVRAEAPMPALRAMEVIEPVLTALAAAHRAGLIHRDVKPENVLISETGQVKVADFGLAKAVGTDTHHTATGGVLIGTVSYLAPEVVVDGRADARADVYAAGVVLYEMLTGAKPHEGESPIAVAYKHVHDDVPPPSRLAPGLPAYVDALVARATARDRDNRPPDAGVLRQQVRRVRQALAEGVIHDPDLVADLLPPRPHHDRTLESAPTVPTAREQRPDDVEGTLETPDLRRAAADVRRDRPERTTALDRRPVLGPPTEPAAFGPPEPPEQHAEPSTRRRRRRRGPLVLLLALLLAVGGGAAAWWFGEGRYEPTPAVVGLALPEARSTIGDAGLVAAVTEEQWSETVPRGEVIDSEPAPGERVLHDGTVDLVVSKGKERYAVPTLAGRALATARASLAASTLAVGTVTQRFSETVAAGIVLSTDPAPGVQLRNSAVVDLVVSKGRRPIKVPDQTGKDADAAERRLTRRGFTVTRTEAYDDRVPTGDVVSQTPAKGTLFLKQEVKLVVSLGPPYVTVPDVVRASLDSARNQLEAAGFDVEVVGRPLLGIVFQTDPGGGASLRKFSTVRVYVI